MAHLSTKGAVQEKRFEDDGLPTHACCYMFSRQQLSEGRRPSLRGHPSLHREGAHSHTIRMCCLRRSICAHDLKPKRPSHTSTGGTAIFPPTPASLSHAVLYAAYSFSTSTPLLSIGGHARNSPKPRESQTAQLGHTRSATLLEIVVYRWSTGVQPRPPSST